jgi:UDP-hydrolysing UDP-N-acetyl-D-glucosamine 2-epimerase
MAQQQPDIVVLYGDRLELLPIATAAVLTRTPIAHVCGGDVTEGALDEQVRHAVTKMAHLHFPSTPLSARRVRQMGEDPTRIHCVGDPALDHFVHGEHASPNELTELLGFTPDHRTLLITLHPETASGSTMSLQSAEFCSALQDFEGSLVITAPAPDPGHQTVRTAMERLASQHPRAVFIESLGSRRYRGLLKRVGAMAGNSSSGIIEAASVPLPVVNVGDRQAGRERAPNVIDVPFNASAIRQALQTALSQQFRQSLQRLNNPYGDGNAAQRITAVLKALPPRDELLRKRWFQPDESMAVS